MPPRRARRSNRRKPRRNIRKPRSSNNKSRQMAFITETIEYSNIDANTSYYNGFSLSQFNRACEIAPSFRWYKPVSVTYTYNPIFNTFQGSGTGYGMPYMYLTMNRTQDNHVYNRFDLQAMGARPRRFNKTIRFTYKPNWCSSGLIVAGQNATNLSSINTLAAQGLKAEWGWLQAPSKGAAANPSQVAPVPVYPDTQPPPGPIAPITLASTSAQMLPIYAANTLFNGHDLFIQQDNVPAGADVCRVTVTVKWAFKDPQNYLGLSQPQIGTKGVLTGAVREGPTGPA